MNSETEYDMANMVYRTVFTDEFGTKQVFEHYDARIDVEGMAAKAHMMKVREQMENEAFYGVKQPKSEPYACDIEFGSF